MTAPLLPPPVHVGLRAILSESKRIISAHFRHFLALFVLFLLPIFFSLSAFPAIYQLRFLSSAPTNIEERRRFLINPRFLIKTLIFKLLCDLFTFIFTLLATGSITYSIFHGFYGRPIKLASAVNSAFTSFFRLVSTHLLSKVIVYGILFLGLVLYALVMATLVLGFQVNSSSPYFISLDLVFVIIAVSIKTYLQVIWTFADVIVVVESSWGFEPLQRSQNLVKGLKRVAFSMLLFFGFHGWIFLQASAAVRYLAADKWKNWAFVLCIMATSALIMLLKLYSLVASTVFYMYSKAMHGELAGKITEEFAGEYVSLPFDDAKVPRCFCLEFRNFSLSSVNVAVSFIVRVKGNMW